MTDTKDEWEAMVAECKQLARECYDKEHVSRLINLFRAIDRLAALPAQPDEDADLLTIAFMSGVHDGLKRALGHPVALRGSLSDAASEAMRWIPVSERLPEVGTDCLVWVKALSPLQGGPSHYAYISRWDEQHEAPLSFSSATIPIGPGWDDFDFDDVTHWMPLPSPPTGEASGSGSAT